MKLEERIAWIDDMGWGYALYESEKKVLLLMAYDYEAKMTHEWEFTLDGEEQIGEEEIYSSF